MTTLSREDWLNEAAELIIDDVLQSAVDSEHPKPPYKISVAPLKSKALGQCHKRAQSTGQKNEIFITAHCDDSQTVLATLTHELIHAYDDCQSGHKNFFAFAARRAGLEGKLTQTVAGATLIATFSTYIEALGPIPHDALTVPNKDKGRNNNKIKCNECGFQANLSRKWAEQIRPSALCPVCLNAELEVITK